MRDLFFKKMEQSKLSFEIESANTECPALAMLAQLEVPSMRKRRDGRIIAISSIFRRESGGSMPCNALKVASISLTKSLLPQLQRCSETMALIG
jgi:NAD(P)-dependent dehydrogenase (short-subunit alcohol dehydrogenase family)